jgi:hypothetical protein
VPRKSVVAAAMILAVLDELASAFEHKTGDKLTLPMLRLGRPSSAFKEQC